MSLGRPGEVYVAGKEFYGTWRFIASLSPRLTWVDDRAEAKAMTFQNVQELARQIYGLKPFRAVLAPEPQTELPLW